MRTLSLREFLEQLPPYLEAFRSATEFHGKTNKTFLRKRTMEDWFMELAAYESISELEEGNGVLGPLDTDDVVAPGAEENDKEAN